MASISRRMLYTRRRQQAIRSPRRWSRFIGLLKWKEFFTLIFYACMTISSLGGALFFGVRSLQGYRKGLTFFYLAMLLFMSVCSLICHLLLIKWRLDRFFQEFSRSKPPQLCISLSNEDEAASGSYSVTGTAVTACAHAGASSSERSNNSCFLCRLKAVLKLFHAYAVFLAALVISLLVLFDLSTGYTASHFRPTLLSIISLTSLQCWVVAVSFAWFINVLVFNDAADAVEGEQPLDCSIAGFTHQTSSPSSRSTRRSNSRGGQRRDSERSGERRPSRRGRDFSEDEKEIDAYGQPQQLPNFREAEGRGKEDTSFWEMPTSDVSTCALATIRGVSSQWGDVEEAESAQAGAGDEEENTASVSQTQGDFRGVSIQPTVIGVPSFTVACMPTMPLALRGVESQTKGCSVEHESRV